MNDDEIRGAREKCPDCGGQQQEIKLIDKGHSNAHTAVQYTGVEAKRSAWMGVFPIEGNVLAFLCSRCGRIALYGAAKGNE